MKVFVLIGKWHPHHYSDGYDRVLGVFSTEQVAGQVQASYDPGNAIRPDSFEIEEFEIDKMP